MNNNESYKEIIEKCKATILRKREAKQAKKQVILDKINEDIEYLQKVRAIVEKRQDTISKKQFIKDLLNAGVAYGEEKQKVYNINSTQKIREKRKYEKDALGGKFKVVNYYDNLHMLVPSPHENKTFIVVPNDAVIKGYIDHELRKEINFNNSKEKLKCFITIKYKMVSDTVENVNAKLH